MKRKRLISLLVLLAAVVTGAWAQTWDSGDCTVTLSDGVMTVSGTGAMADYEDYYNYAPWYGKEIKTIVIESGVTSIGNYAFTSCSKLESVSIPASVTSIGEGAFMACGAAASALTVTFAEGSTPLTISEAAFGYSNLTSINIPNRVTSIGVGAFPGCSKLESVSIPASVTSIGEGAFWGCGMLAKVYIFAPSLTTYGDMAFDENAAGRKIYVLPTAVDTYKAGWPAYAADIEAMTVYATSVKDGTEDAENWSATPSQATEGQTVTITYAGTKSVKSVTAKRKITTGNIMVYFTDALNYGDVNVYYWNDGPDWPGTPMTFVETNGLGQNIYRAEIPATAVGIIFNGNGRQTADITENIEDGSWWYTKEDTDDTGHNKVGYVGKYTEYIVVTNVDANNWTFTMPDGNVELDIEYNPAYPVTISDGDVDAANWSATPTEQSAGQNVTLQYTGKKKIKSVKVVKVAPAATDLSTLTADYEAKDGETLTGTLVNKVKISIADGATVTLKDVTITNLGNDCNWAGINCPGDATLVLEGTNTVCAGRDGWQNKYPGIWIAPDKTLTIQGDGTLTAYSNGTNPFGAGIGAGFDIPCGNIVINSGNITARGGNWAAGIGGRGDCGDITINGGTITAEGGQKGAGIGGGYGSCGNITISGGTITATGGSGGAGIGSGNNRTCGNITISGGTITATGGEYAAGIGGGRYNQDCGTITIKSTVTSVTATKGNDPDNYTESIGCGNYGSGITVKIEAGANVIQN